VNRARPSVGVTLGRYLRAGRLYGVCDEFWQAAADDLDARRCRRLARELGVKFPEKWATRRNGHREAAPDAGLSVENLRSRPTGQGAASADTNGCQECSGQVAYLSRTGVCRRCQWRLSKRRRGRDDGSRAG
jgi:hypothetical protein